MGVDAEYRRVVIALFTAGLSMMLLAAAWIDAHTKRLPDLLNALIFASGLAATWALGRDLIASLIGAGAGYLALLAVNLAYRRARGRDGLGMGDAKLLAALGAWTGWIGLPFILMCASGTGLAFAFITRRKELDELAFGPFLAGSGFLVWLTLAFAL